MSKQIKNIVDLEKPVDFFILMRKYSYRIGEDIFEYGWYGFSIEDFIAYLNREKLIDRELDESLDLCEHINAYEEDDAMFPNGEATEISYFKGMQLMADYLHQLGDKGKQLIKEEILDKFNEIELSDDEYNELIEVYNKYKNKTIEDINGLIESGASAVGDL